MAWIDSHCHLDHVSFNHDLSQVLQQAKNVGIHKFIVPSVGFHQWEEQQTIQKEYPNTFHAYGVHPWFCNLHTEEHLGQLDDLLDNAIAVGECGLDFMPSKPSQATQLHWFEAQLGLAKKHNLPLIIHSVRADDTIVSTLKKHPKSRGVIHGFGGSLQQAQNFIKLGFSIAIGTRLIHSRSKKIESLITQMPLSSILLETDAPDGLDKQTRNEPKELMLVANIIAKLRQQTPEEILDTCSQNTQELFQL
ncbi:MAG: TatD family hydrolase [Ghiorsea sp.]|nr:TatD family hydrolase [Ghiorsea sp.]